MKVKSRILATVVAMVCTCDAQAAAWNGRQEKSADFSGAVNIAYPDSDAVIWQTNGWVAITNDVEDNMFGNGYATDSGTKGIYLLEGGMLTVYQDWLLNGAYNQIRQTGGDLHVRTIKVKNGSIPKDFVFGGSGIADLGWYGISGSNPLFECDATIAFMDNVRFVQPVGVGLIIMSSDNHHIWAYNGGTADYLLHDGTAYTVGEFFAFNGGTRIYRSQGDDNYRQLFGNDPQVRLYEKGGGIEVAVGNLKIKGYDFKTPKNSIKSITLTDEARNNNGAGWDYPPAVEIYDVGGVGTDAAAIVDYDYVNRAITNITVLSGGENYTSPKAQFRYVSGDGNRLLGTPLECAVASVVNAGEFTFSSTNLGSRVEIGAASTSEVTTTNYCSSLVIDMDRLGLADGGKTMSLKDNAVVLYFKNTNLPIPGFPNLTNITIKSGAIHISSSYGYKHDASYGFLPKCYSLQLYGGHLSGGSCIMSNVVIGGSAYLTGHNISGTAWALDGGSSPYHSDINLTTGTFSGWTGRNVPAQPGTMVVDVDSPCGPAVLKGGIGTFVYGGNTIYRGNVRFGGSESNPSTMTIKNYESLKSSVRRRVLLDLSDTNLGVWGTNNVAAVTPPDLAGIGRLKWSAVDRKLYWKPYNGTFVIFH